MSLTTTVIDIARARYKPHPQQNDDGLAINDSDNPYAKSPW